MVFSISPPSTSLLKPYHSAETETVPEAIGVGNHTIKQNNLPKLLADVYANKSLLLLEKATLKPSKPIKNAPPQNRKILTADDAPITPSNMLQKGSLFTVGLLFLLGAGGLSVNYLNKGALIKGLQKL